MEHHQPEHLISVKARTAEAVSPENHEVLSEPEEHRQDKDAGEAVGVAGEADGATRGAVGVAGEADGAAREAVGVARETVGVAREADGAAREAVGVAREADGAAREAVGVAREADGAAREAVGVARETVGVAREADGAAREAVGAAREAVGVAREADGAAREAVGVAREADGAAREAVGVAREADGAAREAVGVARETVGVAREADGAAREAVGVAREADGAAREQEPEDQGSLPVQGQDKPESSPPDASSDQLGPAHQTPPEAEIVGAHSGPQELPQSPRARQPELDFYCVKWIPWKGARTPIITQSSNGPCPLLAIMNILFLQWKVKLPPQKEVITSDELMAHLGDCLLSIKPQEKSEGLQLNFQQNVDDAMTVLPKLATGLDVNVRFTGVSDFEYTPECSIFDLLGIPLYHGWLVDPQSPEAVRAVGKLSYNQLVEKVITCKHSSDPNLVTEGLIAEQFLETTAAQLTYHGLCELTAAAKEGELSVFFRNNHFSTMTKHKSHLYLLVTDQGFLQEEQVVWESLHNVDGDSCFCDSDFHLSHSLGKGPGAEGGSGSPEKQRQVDQDYLIALSLQQQQQPQGTLGLSDLELAQQLQQEEYQQQQGVQPVPARAPSPQARGVPPGRPAGERRRRAKPESDCVLL